MSSFDSRSGDGCGRMFFLFFLILFHFLWSFVRSVRNPYMCIGAWIQGYRMDVDVIIR
jgi:hypothetical protein